MEYNVLYISNETTLCGSAQSLLNMIKGLQQKLINAIVILPGYGMLEESLKDLNIKYYVIPFINGYGKKGTGTTEKIDTDFYSNYSAALQLQTIIQEEKIALVHINSSVNNVGAFAALMAGVPYVWHFREVLEEHFEAEFWDKETKMQLFCFADAHIAISNIVKRKYTQYHNVNSTCIYNGIDIEKYKNELEQVTHPSDMQRFIITGTISKNKGQFDAVRAVELLRKEGFNNIQLDLIGNGSGRFVWFLKQYIRSKNLEKCIELHPFIHDLSANRKQSQYALTTSKMEALGRCTIEAMLAGQIVIGADTGGTKEVIGEDETRGYLYKQGDYHSLAAVMKRALLESDEKKTAIRKNAQRYAEETFSLEKYAESICALYEKVLAAHSEKDRHSKDQFLKTLDERYKALGYIDEVKVSKSNNYKDIIEKWNQVRIKGVSIADVLIERGWKSIAIYGMGALGCKLYEEVKLSEIEVAYVLDQNPEFLEDLVRVKNPDEQPEEIDVIIVTVSKEESEIVKTYKEKHDCNIIGISQLLEEIIGTNSKG